MSTVLDPDGGLVLTLGDTAVVGGYLITNYEEGDRQYERVTASSPFVDDDIEVHARLRGIRLTIDVYMEDTSWANVTAKRTALLDAVEVNGWQFVVGGVTWVCNPADSSSPMPPQGIDSHWRTVSLSVPVLLQRGV